MARKRRIIGRIERVLLGAVFGLAAFIVERRVLRAIKQRGESAASRTSSLTNETVSELQRPPMSGK